MDILKSNKILLLTLAVSSLIHILAFLHNYHREIELPIENLISFELVPSSPKVAPPPSPPQEETAVAEATQPKKIVKKKVVKKKIVQNKAPAPAPTAPVETASVENVAPKVNTEMIEKNYQSTNLMPIRDKIIDKIEYPDQARKLGLTDSGYLIIVIDSQGKITSITVTDFSNKIFQDAVLKAVKKVGRVASHELASIEMRIPINFSLIEE